MEYCGVELAKLQIKSIKVCNRYDYLSSISYKKLIEKNNHLPFFKEISHYKPRHQGVIIRWLYRGLPLKRAINKIEQIIREEEKQIKKNIYLKMRKK